MILNNRFNGLTGAFFYTPVAVRTPCFIFGDFKNTYLFKRPGEEACRAEKVAKWPVVDKACQDDDGCNDDEVGVDMPVKQFKRVKEIVDIGAEY